ncbi:MAG: VOC family protein [Fimbriimonadaceae bacterium]
MTKNPVGINRLDHVSWTVAAVQPVVSFYEEVFGAVVLYSVGPVDAREMPTGSDGADWTKARLGLADALLHFVVLWLPGDIKLELFAFQRPASTTEHPLANNCVGSSHLGLEVADLEAAANYLKNKGCAIFERIDSPPNSATTGISYRYLRDPWNNILELCGRYVPQTV